mgnify:FL=1
MRRFLLLIGAVVILAGDGFLARSFLDSPLQAGSSVTFPNHARVQVDLARTQEERRIGLSGRAELQSGEGMLFLHSDNTVRFYWMKDMLIPIDIIWVDGDTVAGFLEQVPVQRPPYLLYSSVVPVDKVLEVQAGFVATNNVKVGDVLDIELSSE